jgi:hypothetical protein
MQGNRQAYLEKSKGKITDEMSVGEAKSDPRKLLRELGSYNDMINDKYSDNDTHSVLDAVIKATEFLTSEYELKDVLLLLTKEVTKVMKADGCSIKLIDEYTWSIIDDYEFKNKELQAQLRLNLAEQNQLQSEISQSQYKNVEWEDKISKQRIENQKQINIANAKAKDGLDATRTSLGSFTKEMKVAIVRSIEWGIAMGGIYGSLHKIREGIEFIKDLNKNITNIRVVTGMTSQEMNSLSENYNNIAKEMGATTNELMQGATEWFRQGKSLVETEELVKASIIESKLAAIDSAQATEYLTAILNGFKLESKDVIGVIDQMVAVDNATATSVAELSIALQRSSNSAQQAGVSFSRLLGYISTVSSVTRKSASTIGESFKTIFARMGDVKAGK